MARKAIELFRQARQNEKRAEQHVGFYLIGKGLPALEHSVNMRLPIGKSFLKIFSSLTLFCYLSAIALITFALTEILLSKLDIKPIFYLAALLDCF